MHPEIVVVRAEPDLAGRIAGGQYGQRNSVWSRLDIFGFQLQTSFANNSGSSSRPDLLGPANSPQKRMACRFCRRGCRVTDFSRLLINLRQRSYDFSPKFPDFNSRGRAKAQNDREFVRHCDCDPPGQAPMLVHDFGSCADTNRKGMARGGTQFQPSAEPKCLNPVVDACTIFSVALPRSPQRTGYDLVSQCEQTVQCSDAHRAR